MLTRERRRRERLNAATALPAILGPASRSARSRGLADAGRPLIDSTDGPRLLAKGGRLRAASGHRRRRPGHPSRRRSRITPLRSVSVVGTWSLRNAPNGSSILGAPRPTDDPAASGRSSACRSSSASVWGGCSLRQSVNWYDESDVEVGRGIASRSYSRSSPAAREQQQRLGAVEARAQKLERRSRRSRSALEVDSGRRQSSGGSDIHRGARGRPDKSRPRHDGSAHRRKWDREGRSWRVRSIRRARGPAARSSPSIARPAGRTWWNRAVRPRRGAFTGAYRSNEAV